jgi:hypothetical protein
MPFINDHCFKTGLAKMPGGQRPADACTYDDNIGFDIFLQGRVGVNKGPYRATKRDNLI